MAVVILVGDLLGATVDVRAYLLMATWFSIALIEGPWCRRGPDFAERRRRYAVTLLVDTVMLGVAYYYLDAAQFAGIAAFLLIVASAAVVLPKRLAGAVAILVVTVYATLVMMEVAGSNPVRSPVGLAPVTANWPFLAASLVAGAAVVWLVLRMQAQVVRTVRDAETRHDAVAQAAADMIFVVDRRGHIVEVNAAALKCTGYTWDELRALPNKALFPVEEWELVLGSFRRALAGESLTTDVRVVTKTGGVLWTESTLAPVAVDDRPAVVVVARDVTERLRHSELLRQNDAKLDLVLNALNSGFYTIDANQVVTSIRGKGSDSGSAQPNRLLGKNIATIAPSPEQAVDQRAYHEKALAGEVVTWVWPVGSGRWVRSHVAPIRDADGTVVGAAGFWRDETAIVRAREDQDLRWNRFRDLGTKSDAKEGR